MISVGAYDVRYQAYADFSGRGDQKFCVDKPDLVAPGVGILAAAVGGGESVRSEHRWQHHLLQDQQLF